MRCNKHKKFGVDICSGCLYEEKIQLQAENKRLKEENESFQKEVKAGRIYHTCMTCQGTGTTGTMYKCKDCGGKDVRQVQALKGGE